MVPVKRRATFQIREREFVAAYVRPYVLYYRYDGAHDIVYVLRILHGKTRYHARTF